MKRRARNQAQWYPAERGSRSRMATVAAGVDFLAEEVGGQWRLSAWDARKGSMQPVQTFRSFADLREHVDLSAPNYARINRQARQRSGRVANESTKFPPGTLVEQTPKFRKSIGSVTKGPVDGLVLGSRDGRLLVAWSDGFSGQIHEGNVRAIKKQLSPAVARAYVDEAVDNLPKAMAHSFTPEEVELVKAEYGITAERQENRAPELISGPLRLERQSDGLWVVGQGVAVPIDSKREGRELMERLRRRPNPSGVTVLSFDTIPELGDALEVMDLALRPSRMERPVVFRVDWKEKQIVLEGDPDEPGVSQAISALDRAKAHFDVDVEAVAANPKDGTRGKAAGYAYLGQWIGGVLGFGLGGLVGGLAGAIAGGAPGAIAGGVMAALAAGYAGGIYGAWRGAGEGAPAGTEHDASLAAAVGAAIPYLNWFMAPLAAYLATAPGGSK